MSMFGRVALYPTSLLNSTFLVVGLPSINMFEAKLWFPVLESAMSLVWKEKLLCLIKTLQMSKKLVSLCTSSAKKF
eukprot:scaffold20550_cov59-Cylindrotheca_fusiformis.AAC.1